MVVWSLPVLMRLNSRFGENHRIIEFLVPNSRKNAASAIAASAQVRFVRVADIGIAHSERQLCGRSCHCSVQFECPQLTADIPTFDASLPANFSTHQVKGINFALSASRVTDQIPIAARHAGHPQIPSFRREGYLPAATSRRPA